MAISVEFLRNQVNQLASKDQAGYSTDNEFNDNLASAQNVLFEYYYQLFEVQQQVVDALMPFIKEETVLTPNGVGNFPTDYIHRLQVSYKYVKNKGCTTSCKCGNKCKPNGPEITVYPVDYMQTDEEAVVLSSYIRKPSIAKRIFRHTFKNNKIYVYPTTISKVGFKYLRKPNSAFYATTIVSTSTGDFRQYDAANSIDLEWPVQETENFVDLMLFYLGIEIRSSQILDFVKMKQQQALVNVPQYRQQQQ